MARVAILDGEKYFFENGQWVNLYGLPAGQALASNLYEAYLSQHYAESKSKAAHLSYSEAFAVADEYYEKMDSVRQSYSWPTGVRRDHYGLRESAAEVAAYYEVALDKYFDVVPRLMSDLKHILYRLSSSLRAIPEPELCRALVLEYREKNPAAVGEELLASVIAACSDMFKNSGFSDLDSLEEGMGYFADAYVQANYVPSRTVKRAVRRLYKYASESNVQSKAVDEFLLRVADWEQSGFFANC